MCSQLSQGGSRQPSPSPPRTEADDAIRLMELHLAVGTLADIRRRRPNSDTVRCRLRSRGFLTIPTFRLDLSPALAGLFLSGAWRTSPDHDVRAMADRRRSSGTRTTARRFCCVLSSVGNRTDS